MFKVFKFGKLSFHKCFFAFVLVIGLLFGFLSVDAEELSSSGTTTLDTGDSTAGIEIINEENTNNTEVQGFVDQDLPWVIDDDSGNIITNENDGTVTNNLGVNAGTGLNEASTTENVIVNTGDALAYANVVNIVNTNILNSNGFFAFFNQLFGMSNVDLRNLFTIFEPNSEGTAGETYCTLTSCEDDNTSLTATNDNTASISNSIVVRASSGGNTITTDGDALITTGDAYALANVLNIANTNITDSNYLIVSFNNVGDFFGDIILPGSGFFESLMSTFTSNDSGDSIVSENNNSAVVINNATTTAETGLNIATSTGDGSSIVTGNATSSSQITNQINTNLFGADSILIVFRINGEWAGDIFGLPEGILWSETSNGIELYTTIVGANSNDSTVSNITNNNSAIIQNDIQVMALTGENKIDAGGNASINTGNAEANSNIINVVNTNVLGKNWLLLVFNIFGDWFGNLSFGQPDLWVGTQALTDGSIGRGDNLEYVFTITNTGDSDATNVRLKASYDKRLLRFARNDDESGIETFWNLGTIKEDETKTFTYNASVTTDLPRGETPITLTATVEAGQGDGNTEDNTDELTLLAANTSSGGGGGSRSSRVYDLAVTKFASQSLVSPSSTIEYTIEIKNNGTYVYQSKLADILKNENGKIINEQYWNLDKIAPNEKITVTYDLEFSASTTPGNYINYAQVHGYDGLKPSSSNDVFSNVATTSVVISGEVLGLTDCEPYILEFIYAGKNNSKDEVLKLQTFLRENENYDLPITGIYDDATIKTVIDFQKRYSTEILGPWGGINATGNVYLTTKKKINELYCGGLSEFPLTQEEQDIISLQVIPYEEIIPDVYYFSNREDQSSEEIGKVMESKLSKDDERTRESKFGRNDFFSGLIKSISSIFKI